MDRRRGSRPRVEALLIDEDNEDKFAIHGLNSRQVVEVLEYEHLIVPNRKQRRGLFLLIGKDRGGACIAVPIEPTNDPALWRPVTAWRCKDSERARLLQEGSSR